MKAEDVNEYAHVLGRLGFNSGLLDAVVRSAKGKRLLRMRDVLSPGTFGRAAIQEFAVDGRSAFGTLLSAQVNGRPDEFVPEGSYLRLVVNGTLWMSDTPMEWSSNMTAISRARGHVLIGGLGLGMIVAAMFAKETPPETITVVERHRDVIGLVGRQLQARYGPDRLHIVHGDIFTWTPPRGLRFDTIYFDIWPDISAESVPEMRRLHTKYRPKLRAGGWMDSWKRRELLRKGGKW